VTNEIGRTFFSKKAMAFSASDSADCARQPRDTVRADYLSEEDRTAKSAHSKTRLVGRSLAIFASRRVTVWIGKLKRVLPESAESHVPGQRCVTPSGEGAMKGGWADLERVKEILLQLVDV
jgi:hypothetical protein